MSVSVRCLAMHAIKEDLGHVQTQSPSLPIILLQEKLKRFSPFFIFVGLKNLMGLNFLTQMNPTDGLGHWDIWTSESHWDVCFVAAALAFIENSIISLTTFNRRTAWNLVL